MDSRQNQHLRKKYEHNLEDMDKWVVPSNQHPPLFLLFIEICGQMGSILEPTPAVFFSFVFFSRQRTRNLARNDERRAAARPPPGRCPAARSKPPPAAVGGRPGCVSLRETTGVGWLKGGNHEETKRTTIPLGESRRTGLSVLVRCC